MAKKTLTTSYLVNLSNANHDGVTQQIDDRFSAFETDNMMLLQAAAEVHTARQTEDVAFKRFSGKDFASDDLKKEDRLEDQYMSTIRAILNGLTLLPDTEPMRRKADVAVQMFKDFQFSTNDGFEDEARKTFNMVQEWTGNEKYDLAGLGIQEWVTKAHLQAAKVLGLIQQRVDTESAKVKGELADARKATDAARTIREIVNGTKAEVYEIAAESGVDYLKSLGFDIAEDVVEDVDKVAATTACLFFGYFDGATTISESCGGGGGNNELPKKKDNEDELFFALRCHQMAMTMHAPKYRLRR